MKSIRQFIYFFSLILGMVFCLSGCGDNKPDEKKLAELLPDQITSYYLDDTVHTQNVDKITIVKRNTENKSDYIQCEIELSDELIKRTLYEDIYLTNYDTGGWLIDTWYPYNAQKISAVSPPEEIKITSELEKKGFTEISNYTENRDALEAGRYERSFDINESHKYVSFTGNIVYEAYLEGSEPSAIDRGNYNWKTSINTDNMIRDWSPEGKWLLTSYDNGEYPEKVYYNLISYNHERKDTNPDAEGYLAWPAYDGFKYKGEYGNYEYLSSSIEENGDCPSDLKLNITFNSVYGSYSIIISPDTVEGYEGKGFYSPEPCEVQYADSDSVFKKWNDFPKGKDYDWLNTD